MLSLAILRKRPTTQRGNVPNSQEALNEFLRSIERYAFRMAQIAVHDDTVSFALLEKSFIQFAEQHHHRKNTEYALLFYQTLYQNLVDWQDKKDKGHFGLRRFVHQRIKQRFNKLKGNSQQELRELIEFSDIPESITINATSTKHLANALAKLPIHLQQTLLLRYWLTFSVTDTALIIGTQPNQIKTDTLLGLTQLKHYIEGLA